ncbi:MAG: DUF2809 domain-containing protein [Nonlabens sp.]
MIGKTQFLFRRKPRYIYALSALVIFCVEVFIALYVNDDIVRPYLGDLLVVMLIYSILMFFTRFRIITAIMCTLAFCLIVEMSQLLGLIYLMGLQDYDWARMTMGTSFSWVDVIMYVLGAITILLSELLTSSGRPL